MDNITDNGKDIEVKEALVDYKKLYTFADYLTWDDNPRYELIDGVPFLMSSPTWQHQAILGNLHGKIWTFLQDKPCKVFFAPFDVRLAKDTTDDTVVQPDLVIICDKSIMMKTGCQAAPDMVVEILSPSTSSKDTTLKLELYQRTGVREYWIINPESKLVLVYLLENGKYVVKPYRENEKVPIHILDGFEIDLAEVFAE